MAIFPINTALSRLLLLAGFFLLQACGVGGSQTANTGNLAHQNITNQPSAGFSTASISNTNTLSTGVLTELDNEILNKLNLIRSKSRMCGSQQFPATKPVHWAAQLKTASSVHASDMGDNNFFAHAGSDGLRVNARVDATGYQWAKLGENIATAFPSVDQVMNGWLKSPAHCSTLMGADYEEVGAAIDLPSGADYDVYWALIMAKKA